MTGLFENAYRRFKNEPRYRNNAEITDEMWFFFDVEVKDKGNWGKRLKIINKLGKQKDDPNIRVCLLMTTECIEYRLMGE